MLCFFLLEVTLRIAGYGNLEIYEPDSRLFWRLKPNQQCYTKIGRKPVRVNSLGTRGPEFNPVKPAGTFRVLSLGDSRTFGWGLAEEETFSSRLGSMLQAEIRARGSSTEQGLAGARPAHELRVEVINAGVNAWSFQQMDLFLRNTARAWNPDVVVIGEANLWTQFSEKSDPAFVRKFLWRVRLKNLLRRSATYHFIIEVKLKGFYERHRTRFIPVDPRQDQLFKNQQQQDPDAAFRDALRSLCQATVAGGAQPVLVYLPTLDEMLSTDTAAIEAVKQRVAEEFSAPYVTVSKTNAGPKELYLEGDPVHFNARGNEIIARELTRAMAPLLDREQTGHH